MLLIVLGFSFFGKFAKKESELILGIFDSLLFCRFGDYLIINNTSLLIRLVRYPFCFFFKFEKVSNNLVASESKT